MARGIEKPPRWAAVVLVVGLVTFAALGLVASARAHTDPVSPAEQKQMAAAASAADASERAARPKQILIVGDSYTAGSDMGGKGPAGWPAMLRTRLAADGFNVGVTVSACGGAGYTNSGTCSKAFPDLAAAKVTSDDDLIIFFGSRNDRTDAGQVRNTAGAVYGDMLKIAPAAHLLVLGPPWVNGAPPSWIAEDRDEVAAAAASVHATFFDPLTEGWFAGPYAALIGSDGVHPTDEGHKHLLDVITPHVESALRSLPTS